MIGHCTSCLYTGAEWVYLGPQYEKKGEPPVFYYWDCPCCESTKTSPSEEFPPPVPVSHPSRPGVTEAEVGEWLALINSR